MSGEGGGGGAGRQKQMSRKSRRATNVPGLSITGDPKIPACLRKPKMCHMLDSLTDVESS